MCLILICIYCSKKELKKSLNVPEILDVCINCINYQKALTLNRCNDNPGVICEICNNRFIKHRFSNQGIICNSCYDLLIDL